MNEDLNWGNFAQDPDFHVEFGFIMHPGRHTVVRIYFLTQRNSYSENTSNLKRSFMSGR